MFNTHGPFVSMELGIHPKPAVSSAAADLHRLSLQQMY
jgi:hypothetical protein